MFNDVHQTNVTNLLTYLILQSEYDPKEIGFERDETFFLFLHVFILVNFLGK